MLNFVSRELLRSPAEPVAFMIDSHRVGDDLADAGQALRGEDLRRHPGVADRGDAVADRAATPFRLGPPTADFGTLFDDLHAGRQILGSLQSAHTPSLLVNAIALTGAAFGP